MVAEIVGINTKFWDEIKEILPDSEYYCWPIEATIAIKCDTIDYNQTINMITITKRTEHTILVITLKCSEVDYIRTHYYDRHFKTEEEDLYGKSNQLRH